RSAARTDVGRDRGIGQAEEPRQLAVILAGQGLRRGEARQQAAVVVEIEPQVEARQHLVVVVLVVVPVPAVRIERRGRGTELVVGFLDGRAGVADVLVGGYIAQAGVG